MEPDTVSDGIDFTDAVHSIYPKAQIIILSGYDNFEYVKHTLMSGVVDYILKPTLTPEELRQVLLKAAERIPGYTKDGNGMSVNEKRLEKCLTGQESLDTAEFHKAYFYGCFRLYAVCFKSSHGGANEVWEALYKKLTRKLKELQVIKYISVLLHEETAVVLFNYEMHDGPSLKEIIGRINDALLMIYDGIFGIVSSGFSDISLLRDIFDNEVAVRFDRGFYDPEAVLIYAGEDKLKDTSYSRFDFFKFNQLLMSKQSADAVGMLKAYEEDALNGRIDSYSLKNQMKNLIYHYLDSLGLSDAERENIRYESFSLIDGAADITAYKNAMQEVYDRLSSLVGSGLPANGERMKQMLAYISDNYREDLKLEDLSQEFSFNYNYLSTYFTQHMNEGFSDYLNRLRIEEACRLLRSGDTPISQIGMDTGYSDHSYFSRVFKKLTGRTPSEYRRESSREEKA